MGKSNKHNKFDCTFKDTKCEVEDFDNFLKELVKSKKNIFFKHAKRRSKEEKKYAVNMQKYASVTKNINKHKILEFNNLKFLRSNIGKEGLL